MWRVRVGNVHQNRHHHPFEYWQEVCVEGRLDHIGKCGTGAVYVRSEINIYFTNPSIFSLTIGQEKDVYWERYQPRQALLLPQQSTQSPPLIGTAGLQTPTTKPEPEPVKNATTTLNVPTPEPSTPKAEPKPAKTEVEVLIESLLLPSGNPLNFDTANKGPTSVSSVENHVTDLKARATDSAGVSTDNKHAVDVKPVDNAKPANATQADGLKLVPQVCMSVKVR
jgi:hypothetical protein